MLLLLEHVNFENLKGDHVMLSLFMTFKDQFRFSKNWKPGYAVIHNSVIRLKKAYYFSANQNLKDGDPAMLLFVMNFKNQICYYKTWRTGSPVIHSSVIRLKKTNIFQFKQLDLINAYWLMQMLF